MRTTLELPDPLLTRLKARAESAAAALIVVMPYSVISKQGFPLLGDSPRENWRDGAVIRAEDNASASSCH